MAASLESAAGRGAGVVGTSLSGQGVGGGGKGNAVRGIATDLADEDQSPGLELRGTGLV